MRAALLILALFPLCLIIAGCASNHDPTVIKTAHKPQTPKPLPDQFIAVWNHDRPYDMLLEIKKNGWIIEKKRSTGEVTNKYQYKLAYLENPRSAYILVKNRYDNSDSNTYSLEQIFIDIIYSAHSPEAIEWIYSCYFYDDKIWNLSDAEYKKRILNPEPDQCDIREMYPRIYYYRYKP